MISRRDEDFLHGSGIAIMSNVWKKVWKKHRPDPGLLHHSTRGCQYASKEFRSLLSAHQAGASMCRKGNCYDNVAMESFWAAMKTECFGSRISETKEKAKLMIFEYIEGFYNRCRLHSVLGHESPLDFESPQSHKPEYQKGPSRLFRGNITPSHGIS
jgi:transposase InsO family protein